MINETKNIVVLFVMTFFLSTCTEKLDLHDVNPSAPGGGNINDTLYVQNYPNWEGYNKPQDVIAGRETFIYVADTENNRVVMLNIAGQILGWKSIRHPIALAQDHRLNLFVCAQFDTVINGNSQTFSSVFKLDMVGSDHHIESAPVKRILPKTSFDFLRSDREYTGVCVFHDNSYFVSRRGPANSNPIDPDNSILMFRQLDNDNGTKKDTLIGRVPLLEPEGTGLLSTNRISSLTSFPNGTRDIIVTLTGENSFKTQWWRYIISNDFVGYQNVLEPFVTDLMTVNKFTMPEGAALDDADNIFVADAKKDSVYKFNSAGDEMESFGGSEIFNAPHAVAYLLGTLYIADTNNDRILRFTLSTDFD